MAALNSTSPLSTLLSPEQLASLSASASQLLAPLSPLNPQPLFQRGWESMEDNYTEFQIATFGSMLVQVLFYFGTSLPSFVFQFMQIMKSFKVQKNKQHSLSDQWHCLKRVALSKTFIYLPLIMALFFVVHHFGVLIPYTYSTMPHWYEILPRMLFCLVVEDTWHYWAHRALHVPALYGPIHKLHHKFNVPFGLAAEYAHPLETMILGVGFFLPLPLVCNHLVIFWAWLATRMLQTTDAHQGFYFPYLNPLYLLPFYGGVRFHDFHHSYFNANFASTFTFWDRVCGTTGPYYEHEQKRVQQEQKEKKLKGN